MASTLSRCAVSIKEQVFTMTTSASAAWLVISMPSFRSDPSMISASTRFLAQPREMSPTRTGLGAESDFTAGGAAMFFTSEEDKAKGGLRNAGPTLLKRRQRKGFGRSLHLVESRAKTFERVALLIVIPYQIGHEGRSQDQSGNGGAERHAAREFGQVKHGLVHRALLRRRKRGLGLPGMGQLLVESDKDLGDIQLEDAGVSAHKSANVHGGGKDVVIARFEGANVVGPNFGDFGHIIDLQTLGLAGLLQLFCNCRHWRGL